MNFKEQFKNELIKDIKNRWLVNVENANEEMLRISLAKVIQKLCVNNNWINSKKDTNRKVHYFSMEFMIGKQLKTNLVNLNILHSVKEITNELGIDLEKIFKLKEKNTTVMTEIIAGLTTFMAVSYIIFITNEWCFPTKHR